MPLDAVVVGAGPNGLAAAVRLAQAGWRVHVVEANETVGGAARSDALTEPGFLHDLGSAVHPLGVGSPFFRTLPLEQYGLSWIHPDLPLAHPLDDGRAAALHRSLDATADALGADGPAYRRLFEPLAARWADLAPAVLRPLLRLPRHPLLMARFGLKALRSARSLARSRFDEAPARALFAGIAGHSMLPLDAPASAAIALVLGAAGHAVGWPVPRGGAGAVSDALAAYLQALGGTIETGRRVAHLDELRPARAVVLNVTPRQVLRLARGRLPDRYRHRLERWRYGPAAFKIDYALSEPVPWTAEPCRRAGTLHLGGTLDEIASAEAEVAAGRAPDRPYLLAAQPSLFDPTRAPEDKHTFWVYGHVPLGSAADQTGAIERQIERFAPGFRDCVLARRVAAPADLEALDANLVGGDIGGGTTDLAQLVARPVPRPTPYRTPVPGLYLCSSSTPPGGGVHGMCGFHAAEAVLADFGERG